MAEARYREVQYFRQDWLWALLLVGAVPGFLLASVAIVFDSSGPWTAHLPTLVVVALLVFGPLLLFWRARLVTEVREDGLHLKLWPLHWSFRQVSCEEVADAKIVDVSPMADFGGIGVRYNVSLSREGVVRTGPKGYVAESGPGVRIERRESRDLVVTASEPRRLVAALERVCSI